MNGNESGTKNESDEQHRAVEVHENRIEAVKQRRGLPTALREGSVAVLHAVPTNVEMATYSGIPSTLPDPPIFGQSEGDPQNSVSSDGGKVQTGIPTDMTVEPMSYTFLSVEGWFEAATTEPFMPGLVLDGLAEELVMTLKGGLDCLLQLGADLPIYVFFSLLNVKEFRVQSGHYQCAVESLPEDCSAEPVIVAHFDDDIGDAIQRLTSKI